MKKLLWSGLASSLLLISWGVFSNNNSIKAKDEPVKETSVVKDESEKKIEKESPLKPESRYAWGTKPSEPLATFGPTRPDLYKSLDPGVAESFPNKYSFQPKITALTQLYRKFPGRAEQLIKPGSWPPLDSLKQTDVGYYLLGTHMGIKNGRWLDLKLEYVDTGPVKATTETISVGVSRTVPTGGGTVHLAFAVAGSKNTEPIFRMSFIDHETGDPVKMDSGHVTFNDIDYTEWMKVRPTGSGQFDYIAARNDNGILTDPANFTSEQVTMISPENSNVFDDDFTRYFTIGYSNVDSLDIQYFTGGTGINISQVEVPEAMFELEAPSLVSDVDGNLEDEVITTSLIQPIPYRSSLGNLLSLAFEGTIDDSLTFSSSDIQIYNREDQNISTSFIIAKDSKNPQKFTVVAKPEYTASLVDKTEQLRVDVKTTLNKTSNAYKKYQNNATGQLTIPFQMKLNYSNAGGVDSGVMKEVPTNIAFGHINLKKATIHYKNEAGKSLQASQTKLGFLGEKINFSAPTIEGYNLKMPQLVDREVTFSNTEQNVEYVYEKIVPEVTLEQSVDKAKAQPGETLHYKIDVGSAQEAAKDLGSSIISIEYYNDQGQKISTDSIHEWKKGTSYDFSEIPALEGFDNVGVTASSNATGTVAGDDIVIRLSGFKATMDSLVQKKVRYVDENDQSISVDEIYLGRDKYLPNYLVKAKVIPGYALSDGIESYLVIFNETSPAEYVFRYHSTRNYRSLNITELLDTNLENPTNFTWKTKDNVEIPNASVTYDQISRNITAIPPAEGIAYNHESTIEFDATIVSTPVGDLISQTVNLKADYLVDGTVDISTDPPTKTQIVTESQVIVTFIDDGTPPSKIAKDIVFTQEIGTEINLAQEKAIQDTIETLKKKYVLLEPLPSEIVEVTDEVQTIAYKFSGRLFIESFPSNLTFGDKYLSKSFIKEEQPKYDAPLIIGDNRHKKTPWTLTATLEKPLTSEESPSEVLPRALWYKTSKGSKVMLYEGEAQPIETGAASPLGEYNISKNWDTNTTGLQLNVYANEIIQKGDYKASILWQVSATP